MCSLEHYCHGILGVLLYQLEPSMAGSPKPGGGLGSRAPVCQHHSELTNTCPDPDSTWAWPHLYSRASARSRERPGGWWWWWGGVPLGPLEHRDAQVCSHDWAAVAMLGSCLSRLPLNPLWATAAIHCHHYDHNIPLIGLIC